MSGDSINPYSGILLGMGILCQALGWGWGNQSVCEREKPFTIFLIVDFRLKLSLSSPTGAYKECRHKLLV